MMNYALGPFTKTCAGCGKKIRQGTGDYWYDSTQDIMCDDLGVHDPVGIGPDNESLYAKEQNA